MAMMPKSSFYSAIAFLEEKRQAGAPLTREEKWMDESLITVDEFTAEIKEAKIVIRDLLSVGDEVFPVRALSQAELWLAEYEEKHPNSADLFSSIP